MIVRQPGPELADRCAVEGRLDGAGDDVGGDVLDVLARDLHAHPAFDVWPVAVDQDGDRARAGRGVAGIAGGAGVGDERLVVEAIEFVVWLAFKARHGIRSGGRRQVCVPDTRTLPRLSGLQRSRRPDAL